MTNITAETMPRPATLATRTTLPSAIPGYALAACFLAAELWLSFNNPAMNWRGFMPLMFVVSLSAAVYMLFCVYRIHKYLAVQTDGGYPITPGKGFGFLLIPFFNLYWIFAWTNQVADYINAKGTLVRMSKGWTGGFMLAGYVLMQLDGAIGIAVLYGALHVLISKLRSVENA